MTVVHDRENGSAGGNQIAFLQIERFDYTVNRAADDQFLLLLADHIQCGARGIACFLVDATLSGVEMGLELAGVPYQRGGVLAALDYLSARDQDAAIEQM